MVPAGDYMSFMKKNVIPKFEKKYPNVELTVSNDKNLKTRISAGDEPDVYTGTFGYQPAMYAKSGKIVNLEKFKDSEKVFDRISDRYITRNYNGLYYVPWNVTTQLMIYNKELFREAGLDPEDPPETFAEFLKAAKKINNLPNRKDGSEIYGTVFWNEALSWGGWYWTMLTQIYYNMNDGQYQLFNNYGTDIVFDKEEANMDKFYEFAREAQQYAPPTMKTNFFSRNIGMWLQFGYGWMANLDEAKGEPMKIGEDVGVAPIPVLEKGDTHWSTLDGRSIMIFRSNPEKERLAWELVKFLMKKDINLKACKALGQLPTLKSLQDVPYFNQPETKPFVEQLKHTLTNEPVAELGDVANILQQMYIKTVIKEKISPEKAVEKAAKKARELLKK
ncbi:extracellular solute-binding protein [Halobacteroides halobius]